MQLPTNPVGVVLTWSLQSALSAGLAIACGGLAVTFRRPAMRVLAAFWSLVTFASVFIWAALASQSLGLGPKAGPVFAALAFPLTPVLAFVLLRHLLQLLAGRTARAFPTPAVLGATGGGGLVFAFALMQLTASQSVPGTASPIAIVSSAATIIGYVVLVVLAWRAYAEATGHRPAIKLVGLSFLFLAIRSSSNLVVAAVSSMRGEQPSYGAAVSTIQISLLVIAGVTQLIAVLGEERASIVAQGEQLRAAEAAMAKSYRLEALGRMAGGVAHDFNNLLGIITLSAESAGTAPPAGHAKDLELIRSSAARGGALTRQLLAFARQAPQVVTRFDANAQLDALTPLLQRVVERNAALEISAAGPPLIVEMDSTQFEQVVMNLVVNARDATPKGGKITVSLAAHISEGAPAGSDAGSTSSAGTEFVRLAVTDSGAGIPADVLPHIFEPFYTTKKEGEGTGLGLATCDAIVRGIGGRIDVHSVPGKGTWFDVLIPRVTGA